MAVRLQTRSQFSCPNRDRVFSNINSSFGVIVMVCQFVCVR
jgi:hypothetical protein